jgi:hypothetical protein
MQCIRLHLRPIEKYFPRLDFHKLPAEETIAGLPDMKYPFYHPQTTRPLTGRRGRKT